MGDARELTNPGLGATIDTIEVSDQVGSDRRGEAQHLEACMSVDQLHRDSSSLVWRLAEVRVLIMSSSYAERSATVN